MALHRIGETNEVSRIVLLDSDETSFPTGADLVVDGGETAVRATAR